MFEQWWSGLRWFIADPWWGWQPPAVSGKPKGEWWSQTVAPQNVSLASGAGTRGSSWRTCEGSSSRRKLRQSDGALKTWECRHPDTWDSRVSPSPSRAGRWDRWEGRSASHRRPGDRSRSLRPDISQSSGRILWWSGCIWHLTSHYFCFQNPEKYWQIKYYSNDKLGGYCIQHKKMNEPFKDHQDNSYRALSVSLGEILYQPGVD